MNSQQEVITDQQEIAEIMNAELKADTRTEAQKEFDALVQVVKEIGLSSAEDLAGGLLAKYKMESK